jgi:hypothetical protein
LHAALVSPGNHRLAAELFAVVHLEAWLADGQSPSLRSS